MICHAFQLQHMVSAVLLKCQVTEDMQHYGKLLLTLHRLKVSMSPETQVHEKMQHGNKLSLS